MPFHGADTPVTQCSTRHNYLAQYVPASLGSNLQEKSSVIFLSLSTFEIFRWLHYQRSQMGEIPLAVPAFVWQSGLRKHNWGWSGDIGCGRTGGGEGECGANPAYLYPDPVKRESRNLAGLLRLPVFQLTCSRLLATRRTLYKIQTEPFAVTPFERGAVYYQSKLSSDVSSPHGFTHGHRMLRQPEGWCTGGAKNASSRTPRLYSHSFHYSEDSLPVQSTGTFSS